jgi:hypothetical protein
LSFGWCLGTVDQPSAIATITCLNFVARLGAPGPFRFRLEGRRFRCLYLYLDGLEGERLDERRPGFCLLQAKPSQIRAALSLLLRIFAPGIFDAPARIAPQMGGRNSKFPIGDLSCPRLEGESQTGTRRFPQDDRQWPCTVALATSFPIWVLPAGL